MRERAISAAVIAAVVVVFFLLGQPWLTFGIAALALLAAVEVFRGTDTPIIYGAVTDPVGAELVPSATDPSGNENVTGVSDMIPVAAHLRLLKELSPEIITIGIVYNPGEANSTILTDMALAAAPSVGVAIVTAWALQASPISPSGRASALMATLSRRPWARRSSIAMTCAESRY